MTLRVHILLHSTTGNTRVVTRYAAAHLRGLGMEVTVQNIARDRTVPDLDQVDLLGVAFPVMYLWPTLALLQVLSRIRAPVPGTPAFVLATAAGDPGAALHIACERLEARGFSPVGGHWVIAPSNFPMHVAPARFPEQIPVVRRFWDAGKRLGRRAWTRYPVIRPLLSVPWLEASEPLEVDRVELDRYLDEVAGRAMAVKAGARAWGPRLEPETIDLLVRAGYAIPPEKAVATVRFVVDPERCEACNACEAACPVNCIVTDEEGIPRFGPGCTGCFACYNACPHGALSGMYAPAGGKGRYEGPPRAMRELFRVGSP